MGFRSGFAKGWARVRVRIRGFAKGWTRDRVSVRIRGFAKGWAAASFIFPASSTVYLLTFYLKFSPIVAQFRDSGRVPFSERMPMMTGSKVRARVAARLRVWAIARVGKG